MTNTEMIELAKAYVALSNAHRVDLIQAMFNDDSVYQSTGVGEHAGAEAIGEMMRGFFAAYPDVHWSTQDFRCADSEVTFDFAMKATAVDNGESLVRRGIEQIEFDAGGSIAKLRVIAS